MAKIRFRDLTPAQVKCISNGCGGKGSAIPVPQFIFTASCDHHDFNYWLGYREEDRKLADDQFYQAMKNDYKKMLEDKVVGWFKYNFYKAWAYIYYQAVRLKGKEFFHYGDSERTREDFEARCGKCEGCDSNTNVPTN